jgi:cell division transport system permease protein
MSIISDLLRLATGDKEAERSVPPTGFTATLTLFTAAAMAFLAVFALALSLATDRLATRWSEELARTSTLRISAPDDQKAAQTAAALRVLETTAGIASARALTAEEQRALLEPWFGPDLPVETLPIPQLIEIIEDSNGYDATGLRARLQAEVPGAVLDDHTRWREPLISAANRLRTLGLLSIALIGGSMAAMITLAARAALAANVQVIRVMRLVGAQDQYIASAFVRRFTLRSLNGAVAGSVLGAAAVMLLPDTELAGGFLTGVALRGTDWFWAATIPVFAALVGFAATRAAALRTLKEKS